jgi:hypothetical protein
LLPSVCFFDDGKKTNRQSFAGGCKNVEMNTAISVPEVRVRVRNVRTADDGDCRTSVR